MKIINSIFLLLLLLTIDGHSQNDTTIDGDLEVAPLLEGYVSVDGFLSQESSLPFWFFTNINNTISEQSTFRVRAGLKKQWDFNNQGSLTIGGGLNAADGINNNVQVEELYATYIKKWLNITAGVKHRDQPYKGLSTINGDILWTSNARSIPGLLIKTESPIRLTPWLSAKAELAHYELNDNRVVDNARIHYKSLDLIFNINKNQRLTAGLSHYVQWAGTSPETGEQSANFSDFVRLFFGKSGGSTRNDQINALGNHLGSYILNYNIKLPNKEIDIYHHSLFEDRSGRELNNFPDGVWGVAVQLKDDLLLNTVLVEYVQTVSQSGRPRFTSGGENQQSGGDNYFSNSIYRSGWTYQGNIIGLPFIIRNSTNTFTLINRSYAVQIGAAGSYHRFDYKMKTTFVRNLGTFSVPFETNENAIYTYGTVSYGSKIGDFNIQLGLDVSNIESSSFGAGIGYKYNWN